MKKKLKDYLRREGLTTGVIYFGIGYLAFTVWWQWYFVYPYIKVGNYGDALNMLLGFNPIVLIVMPILFSFIGWAGGILNSLEKDDDNYKK